MFLYARKWLSGNLYCLYKCDKYRRLGLETCYVESECSAFDDMFPTIDPCEINGLQYLDHGEVSNHKAVYDATCYAIQCGYKNLAFIGSENYSNSFRERLDGFQSCVKDHANSISKVYTATGDYNDIQIPVDYEELEMVLSAAQLPLACICANDIVATLVYELAAKINLSIPKDIAVIGFDNISSHRQEYRRIAG